MENIAETNIPVPKRLNDIDENITDILLTKELDTYLKRKNNYRQNKASLFLVMLVQCTDDMKAKLESFDTYENLSENSDVLGLLIMLKMYRTIMKPKDTHI